MNLEKSKTLMEEARRWMPGGVNSPVRAFTAVGGTPPVIVSAEGAFLRDADGNEYLDLVGSWGPLILGHGHPAVKEAVRNALERGTSFGAPTEGEALLARRLVEAVPSLERVRLVNSGTEAAMSAVRLARGYTGRDGIVKFEGCYHGHGDCFLIQAGSGALTLGAPSSPGVTRGAAKDTFLARYNDLGSVKALFQEHPGRVAAVIVEPVAGNMGCIPPEAGFLEGLRSLCTEEGALLVFDEVITGFRVAPGGAQARFGVTPDLTVLGKIIGGGLPVGAYGGRAEIMARLAPEGPVYQAGTLSGNPLAVAAGLAAVEALSAEPPYDRLEALGARLEAGLRKHMEAAPFPLAFNRVGSMATLFFGEDPVRDLASASACDTQRFARYFHEMLDRGIYLPPSPFETFFLSAAHTKEMVDRVVEAAGGALQACGRA